MLLADARLIKDFTTSGPKDRPSCATFNQCSDASTRALVSYINIM